MFSMFTGVCVYLPRLLSWLIQAVEEQLVETEGLGQREKIGLENRALNSDTGNMVVLALPV